MTLYEKLDKILFFLKDRSDLGAYFTKEYIWIHYISLTPEFEIKQQLFDEIFERLIEDDLIRKRELEEAKPTYHLTTKGYESNGYVEGHRQKDENNKYQSHFQKKTLWASLSINKWTKWIALGTIALILVAVFSLVRDCSNIPK